MTDSEVEGTIALEQLSASERRSWAILFSFDRLQEERVSSPWTRLEAVGELIAKRNGKELNHLDRIGNRTCAGGLWVVAG